jgi:hypothetical protein
MNELETGNLKYKWLWLAILPVIVCWFLLSFLLWNDDSGRIIFGTGFLAAFVIILLFKPVWPWIIMAFFIPLSISTPLVGEAHRIAFPGEAMAILLMGITGAMWLMYPDNLQKLLSHPLSVAIFIWVAIVWLTALLTSTMTLVSVKSATIHSLYILTFYLAGAWITGRFPGLSQKIFLASAISVSLITLIIAAKYAEWSFSPMVAPVNASAFFQ